MFKKQLFSLLRSLGLSILAPLLFIMILSSFFTISDSLLSKSTLPETSICKCAPALCQCGPDCHFKNPVEDSHYLSTIHLKLKCNTACDASRHSQTPRLQTATICVLRQFTSFNLIEKRYKPPKKSFFQT